MYNKAALHLDLALLQTLCRRRGSRVSVPILAVVEGARLDEVVAVVVVQVEGDVRRGFLRRSDVEVASRQDFHSACTHKGVAHDVERSLVFDCVAMRDFSRHVDRLTCADDALTRHHWRKEIDGRRVRRAWRRLRIGLSRRRRWRQWAADVRVPDAVRIA